MKLIDYPKLIQEWDFDTNLIDPYNLIHGIYKKAWWVCCEKGHSWDYNY